MGTPLMNYEKHRMHYIRSIYKDIMNMLYASMDRRLEESMWQIAVKNQTLVKGVTATFFYKGRWWPVNPIRPKECNRILDPSLYSEVKELIEEYSTMKDSTRIGIETMVGNFLSVAGHIDDFNRLFPEGICNLMQISEDIFNIKDPLPDELIQEHLDKNKENLRYFKKLLITQLLLKR